MDESRLIKFNINTQEVIWSEKVPDNNIVNLIIINDKILLTSNHFKSGFGESAIYAYDINTGLRKFIHEFPRNRNNDRYVKIEILEKYNAPLLIHGEKVNSDIDIFDMISESDKQFSIILTKIDKCAINFVKSQNESLKSLMKNYKSHFNKIFSTSSNKNIGIIDMQKDIFNLSKI